VPLVRGRVLTRDRDESLRFVDRIRERHVDILSAVSATGAPACRAGAERKRPALEPAFFITLKETV
jgi:hypothetical protein